MTSALRGLAVLTVLLVFQAQVAASVMRIDLNKGNQGKAGLKFAVTTRTDHGLVTVRLVMPRNQTELKHLWRVDVVMRKDKKTVVSAPLETKLENQDLTAELLVDPDAMKGLEIWVRTGEHAPLAETIYAIDVGSYK